MTELFLRAEDGDKFNRKCNQHAHIAEEANHKRKATLKLYLDRHRIRFDNQFRRDRFASEQDSYMRNTDLVVPGLIER